MQEFTDTSEAFDTSNSCNLLLVSVIPFSVRFSINFGAKSVSAQMDKKGWGGWGGEGEEKTLSTKFTSSRISLFLSRSSGKSCINLSMAFKPPFSFTAADLSNTDLGIVCPDKSSMAAGKFSDARTLKREHKSRDVNSTMLWT